LNHAQVDPASFRKLRLYARLPGVSGTAFDCAGASVIAIVPWQNSNSVHFLFMTAMVRQNAEPCWHPGSFSDSQPYLSDMPIILLEIKTAFGPEDTAAMTAAFDEALKRLNLADREAPIATSVAKKIIRLAKRGERNPTRLTEGVISSFRANPIPL
jgi:hypothetical protein